MADFPKRYRVKLRFEGPVHFGFKEKTYNLTDVIAHSDTIFGGIVNCYYLLYGSEDTENLLEKFRHSPPFKISSAFLYADGEFYVPKPLDMDLTEVTGDIKAAKKIRFIPLVFLGKAALSEDTSSSYSAKGSILLKKGTDTPYTIIERPRVNIDRVNFGTGIYYVSGCRFREGSGLWFYLDVYDESEDKKVKAAIRLLGDEGLGGERTYGFGIFEPRFEEEGENYNSSCSEKHLLLSLYYPAEGEKASEFVAAYSILDRGGYAYSPTLGWARRKKVRMLAEGSVFKGTAGHFGGAIVDVTPDEGKLHKIYKYGLAYTVPL